MKIFLETYFELPVVLPNLTYGCPISDNVRLFHNARGFISPHGGAFANLGIISEEFFRH